MGVQEEMDISKSIIHHQHRSTRPSASDRNGPAQEKTQRIGVKCINPAVISSEINLVRWVGEEASATQSLDYHHLLLLFTKCVISFDYSRSQCRCLVSRRKRKKKKKKSLCFQQANGAKLSGHFLHIQTQHPCFYVR